MIQVFYSTKEKSSILSDTTKSLGGYISTNSFLNGKKTSFFPDFYDLESIDCRLLVLKNITTDTKNCSLYLEYGSNVVDYKYSLISPYIDECGDKVFEIISEGSEPMYSNFIVGSEVSTFELVTNQTIGIWIKRIKKEVSSTVEEITIKSSCDVEHLPLISDKITEVFNLKLSW